MKSITIGKKERGFAVAGGKTPDAEVVRGTPQVVSSRSHKKKRCVDVTDREFQIWRDELL